MENELNFLEERVAELITRMSELRAQNSRLNDALTATLKENAALQIRTEQTAMRIKNLIEQLPKAEEETPI